MAFAVNFEEFAKPTGNQTTKHPDVIGLHRKNHAIPREFKLLQNKPSGRSRIEMVGSNRKKLGSSRLVISLVTHYNTVGKGVIRPVSDPNISVMPE